MIKLAVPTEEMKDAALSFRQEFYDNGEMTINGSGLFDRIEDYSEWLNSVTMNRSEETVDPNWVVTDTYFAVNETGRIVGIIDLRHELNDFLKDLGNTGLSVRPSERRMGYAGEMLSLIIEKAGNIGMSELYLSAKKSNTPSIKTITKNGGRLIGSFIFEEEETYKYIITV